MATNTQIKANITLNDMSSTKVSQMRSGNWLLARYNNNGSNSLPSSESAINSYRCFNRKLVMLEVFWLNIIRLCRLLYYDY